MECLAAFGTAVNVLTFVDMAWKTISRVQDYTSQASDIPPSLRSSQLCLPLLAHFLNNAKPQGLYNQEIVKDVITECNKQLKALEKEAKRIIPLPADTKRQRWSKAIISLQTELRIQQAEQDIEKNEKTLALWILASNTTNMASPRSISRNETNSSTTDGSCRSTTSIHTAIHGSQQRKTGICRVTTP